MKDENKEVIENSITTVRGFSDIANHQKTKQEIFTNIENKKKIFNLETKVDYKINDCKGESLRVKEILIKRLEKELENPIINEDTGEIKDKEIKIITIVVDDNDKSYVTASKSFGIQMIRYLQMFGIDSLAEGLEIRICEKDVKNSSNKALGFELI